MANNEKAPVYGAYEDLIRTIPFGRVMHYEGVANFVGRGIHRSVAHKLSELPKDTDVPWWRVVNKKGKYGYIKSKADHAEEQIKRLEAEGVVFDKSTQDCRFILEDYRYYPTNT